jgi:pyruvate ferredoxin oxidoreductase alpha subunit
MGRVALTGDEAAAFSMMQIEPDVVAAYPITPQTEIVMAFSQYVADGKVRTELIPVESEHSAMSACVGASASGARTMTATAANGLALMWEILYITASMRLPIVMPVVNRALSAPINIHCDHADSMGARDTGWIQCYCENAQEVYESIILAVRIAEHPDILLPVIVCQDGFITSHSLEAVEVFDSTKVKAFIGEYTPSRSLLDIENPVTYGPLDLQDYYFEHKYQQAHAMQKSVAIIPGVCTEFEKAFGKKLNMVEGYCLDDAETAIVVLSSTAGTSRVVVDELREEGIKAGLLKLRFFRPFPADAIKEALRSVRAVAVLDRSDGFSTQGGPLFREMRSIFYNAEKTPLITNYIYGLGGREIDREMIKGVYHDLSVAVHSKKADREIAYLGVRE